MKIVRVCLHCGTIFPKPLGYLHRNAGDFCDRQCYLAWCDCQEEVYEAGEPIQEAVVQGYQNLAVAILRQGVSDLGHIERFKALDAFGFLQSEGAILLAEELGIDPQIWREKCVHLDVPT